MLVVCLKKFIQPLLADQILIVFTVIPFSLIHIYLKSVFHLLGITIMGNTSNVRTTVARRFLARDFYTLLMFGHIRS